MSTIKDQRVEILINRQKFILRGGLFSILALIGVWLFLSYAHSQTFMTPWVMQLGAAILTFIFGILATNDLQKGLGNPVGLVITPEGFIDHASNLGIGLIRWKDIKRIWVNEELSEETILIELKKPDSLNKKTVNPLQKNLMNTNIKLHGTPIVIQTTHLMIHPVQLFTELEGRL